MVGETRKNYLRTLRKLCRDKKIMTVSQFYDLCDYKTYEQLVEFSAAYHEIIKSAVALEKKYQLEAQCCDRWRYAGEFASKTPRPEVFREIDKILSLNRIDKVRFKKAVENVIRMNQPKINSLRFWGVPNSGKTLLANCICAPFVTCYMNNHGSENEFFISNMLNKAIILCEELYITIATAEDFKSVLGGQPLDIAKKYEEKQILRRTPVVITSNYQRFGRGHLNATDEKALCLRCENFQFVTTVEPSVTVTPEEFWAWMLF
ncbi:TPA_asm: nS1 [Dog feces bidnaparvovirus]|nr:TPA_asm: nS1 [Dog feces bidnaparvovirus]